MNSVAIIGGGITGLSAGYRLAQSGANVKVFDASARVGGVIQSIRSDGRLVEFGPNSILETSPVVTQLIADLGLQDSRIDASPSADRRYVVRDRNHWSKCPAGRSASLAHRAFSPLQPNFAFSPNHFYSSRTLHL